MTGTATSPNDSSNDSSDHSHNALIQFLDLQIFTFLHLVMTLHSNKSKWFLKWLTAPINGESKWGISVDSIVWPLIRGGTSDESMQLEQLARFANLPTKHFSSPLQRKRYHIIHMLTEFLELQWSYYMNHWLWAAGETKFSSYPHTHTHTTLQPWQLSSTHINSQTMEENTHTHTKSLLCQAKALRVLQGPACNMTDNNNKIHSHVHNVKRNVASVACHVAKKAEPAKPRFLKSQSGKQSVMHHLHLFYCVLFF